MTIRRCVTYSNDLRPQSQIIVLKDTIILYLKLEVGHPIKKSWGKLKHNVDEIIHIVNIDNDFDHVVIL
jgi:hypothetical protein